MSASDENWPDPSTNNSSPDAATVLVGSFGIGMSGYLLWLGLALPAVLAFLGVVALVTLRPLTFDR